MSEEVRFNVLNHMNVPLHEVLTDADASALLKQYGIVREQLPKIKNTDAAAKAVQRPDGSHGVRPGEIVRITRRSPTAGVATAYRLVIEAI